MTKLHSKHSKPKYIFKYVEDYSDGSANPQKLATHQKLGIGMQGKQVTQRCHK